MLEGAHVHICPSCEQRTRIARRKFATHSPTLREAAARLHPKSLSQAIAQGAFKKGRGTSNRSLLFSQNWEKGLGDVDAERLPTGWGIGIETYATEY
ncbi:MAG: hypothetical protein AAGD09_23110 [Cyanobacteria bacterium P01_F01_bin.56]